MFVGFIVRFSIEVSQLLNSFYNQFTHDPQTYARVSIIWKFSEFSVVPVRFINGPHFNSIINSELAPSQHIRE